MSNEINDPSNIELGLADAANGIDVGNSDDMLVTVHETVGKRRRRRNAMMGVAAAGALVVSGVAIANVAGGDRDDRLLSTPATDPVDESNDDLVDEPILTTPPTTALAVPDATATGGAPIQVSVVPASGTVVTDAAFGASQGNSAQVLAWKGGFLAIRQEYQPQALPTEFPEEITEQFSQEVIDLFAEGLPATIDEAIDMLNEAGLYDEVSQIVVNNPDVSNAIYGEPTEAPEITTRFSTDGVEWSDIDVAFPAGLQQIWNMSSTGDRIATIVEPARPADADQYWRPETFEVVWSDDLVTWTTQSFAAPQGPADLADYERFQVYPSQLVATQDAWMLMVESNVDVDVMSLIDPELRDELESDGGGYGYGSDNNGVEIYLGGDPIGPDGEPESIRFTWEELGVEAPSSVNEPQSSLVITSDWVSEPVVHDVDNDLGYRQILALDNGFASASYGEGVAISADGFTWETIAVPGVDYVESIMPVGDTVVAFGGSTSGEPAQFLLDRATGTWTELEIAGLPEQFSVGSFGNGAAILYEHDEDFSGGFPEAGGQLMFAEVDGYRFELLVSFADGTVTGTYTLTDLGSGAVVSTETLSLAEGDDDFEFAEEVYDINGGDEGFRVFDPETGDELVAVAFDDMTMQDLDSDGVPVDVDVPVITGVVEDADELEEGVEFESYEEADYIEPPQWLLATDGTTWLVELLPASSPEFSGYGQVVMVDGVALIAKFDGTFVRYEIG